MTRRIDTRFRCVWSNWPAGAREQRTSMANRFADNAFTSRQALDPDLRKVARFLPRGHALHRGYKSQRAVMRLDRQRRPAAQCTGYRGQRTRQGPLHRPPGLPVRAPALLWIHGGGTIMGTAVQDDKFCRKLSRLTGIAVAAVEHRLAPEHPTRHRSKTVMQPCYGWRVNHGWTRIESPSAGPVPVDISRQRSRNGRTIATTSSSPIKCWFIRCSTIAPAQTATAPSASCGPKTTTNWPGSGTSNGADPDEAAPARRPDLSGLPPAWIGVGNVGPLLPGVPGIRATPARGGRARPRGNRPRRVPRVRPARGQGADLGEILRQPARPAMGRPGRAGG